MRHIVFEYRDGEWRRQECTMRSLEECISFYGLEFCEYRIISDEEVL